MRNNTKLSQVFVQVHLRVSTLVFVITNCTMRVGMLVELARAESLLRLFDASVDAAFQARHVNDVYVLGCEKVASKLELGVEGCAN